jgi:transcriptional regulator with XRE-family HTH domain
MISTNKTIKIIREHLKIPSSTLAAKCCLHRSYISNLESSRYTKNTTLPILEKIAEGLGISLMLLIFLSIDNNIKYLNKLSIKELEKLFSIKGRVS